MKPRLLLLILFCLTPGWIFSQNLLKSRKTSYYTYFFKLTEPQANQVYKKGMSVVDSTFFHTKADSLPTDSTHWRRRLPVGHYLRVFVSGDRLIAEFFSKNPLDIQLINNNQDLGILVKDSLGTLITDAEVAIRGKKVPFSAKTQRYQLRKTSRNGLLAVTRAGHTSYFQIDHKGKTFKIIRFKQLHRRIWYMPPIRFVWLPIRPLIRSIRWGEPTGWVEKLFGLFDPNYRDTEENSTGYLVLDKPKYRPGDTVHFKAWVANAKGRPVKKEMKVWIGAGYFGNENKKVVAADLKPYRKGGYSGEFVLSDSLKLKLDSQYYLTIGKETYLPYRRGAFRYEDYELKSTKYTFRTDPENELYAGGNIAFYAEGKDANDLNLLDAQLELTVLTDLMVQPVADSLFLPDTLWHHTQKLDPLGETKIMLPDSLLPQATFSWIAKAVFTNSDNERVEIVKKIRYAYDSVQVHLKLEKDSLRGQYLLWGKSAPETGRLLAFSPGGDTLLNQTVTLPFVQLVNPHILRYQLHCAHKFAQVNLNTEGADLQCYAYRTADSLFISVDNPRQIPFWYTLYRKNRPLARGKATTWEVKQKATQGQNYFVSIQYAWAGTIKEQEYKVSLADKVLNVTLDQPQSVYPGQTTELGVTVTDVKGKPVPYTDLTVWGITSRFTDYAPPGLEDFSKKYPGRKLLHSFSESDPMNYERSLNSRLEYPQWEALAGLDSIAWFQFLYPKNGRYDFIKPIQDTLAQLAPFVVEHGKPLDIHLLYIDEKLVYFSWAKDVSRYTFPVKTGYHRVRMRTQYYDITVDSVWVKGGNKLIFSIDAVSPDSQTTVELADVRLTVKERNLVERTAMPVRSRFMQQELAISQDNRIQLYRKTGSELTILFGPMYPQPYLYKDQAGAIQNEQFEPSFEYEFNQRVIKMREASLHTPLNTPLRETHQAPPFTDSLLTWDYIRDRWTKREAVAQWEKVIRYVYTEPNATTKGFGRLQVDFGKRDSIQHLLLFKVDQADFVRLYPGTQDIFHQLEAGEYFLVGLTENQQYFRINGLNVKVNGLNFYRKHDVLYLPANTFSQNLQKILTTRIQDKVTLQEQKKVISNDYRPGLTQAEDPSRYTQLYQGVVFQNSEDFPVPGATVMLKGTSVGAFADDQGRFRFFGPPDKTLVVSFLGFEPQEVTTNPDNLIMVDLKASALHLDEVVVIGYATQTVKMITGTVTTIESLQGRASGVQTADADWLSIRGARSNSEVYIIDGILTNNLPAGLREDQIGSMDVLKGDAAIAIYGSKAANGVVVITTKDFLDAQKKALAATSDEPLRPGDAGNSLRTDFRDNAFWQPRLLTGSDGKARFTVTFPDDITKWKTFALAMGPGRQTGQANGEIKSYKALMAQLATPRFLVTGDSVVVIGKTLNYTPEVLDVTTRFTIGKQQLPGKTTAVLTSVIDTLLLTAPEGDSLSMTYELQRSNGYFDGEKRNIPLVPAGTRETTGFFLALDTDTTFTIRTDASASGVTLRAWANPLHVMKDELEYVRNYHHLCNEQAASRLKSVLMLAKVKELLGEPENMSGEVKKLIQQLEKTQSPEGYWGWWASGKPNYWITTHVVEALLAAEKAGYVVKFDRDAVIRDLVYVLESSYTRADARLEGISMLHTLNAKADFRRYVDTLNKDTTLTRTQYLRLTEVKQALKLPYTLDSLNAWQNETLFGNLYWGRAGFHPYENAFTPTLMAYRILRNHGGEENRLQKIRNYLLQSRSEGNWPNTYISTRVLETILPEVMEGKKEIIPPVLKLSGAVKAEVKTFPFETKLTPGTALEVAKSGSTPVYLSTFSSHFNPNPEPVAKDFVVKSWFVSGSDSLTVLEGGKPADLVVQVQVKKDAEFLMLEIPIPAGCSYESKRNPRYSYGPEVHREYYKDRVYVYCERMTAGKYTFKANLLPRYSGTYTLNPARMEHMYFPVFFGRNELKKVKIR